MYGKDSGFCIFFFFKQKTAYEMRISDWSSDVCSSDLPSDSALSPASLVKNAFIPGIVMVRYISPNEKGRSGLAAIHDAMPTKAVRADSVQNASPFSGEIGRASCRERVCTYV